jgi:hypothetical protein
MVWDDAPDAKVRVPELSVTVTPFTTVFTPGVTTSVLSLIVRVLGCAPLAEMIWLPMVAIAVMDWMGKPELCEFIGFCGFAEFWGFAEICKLAVFWGSGGFGGLLVFCGLGTFGRFEVPCRFGEFWVLPGLSGTRDFSGPVEVLGVCAGTGVSTSAGVEFISGLASELIAELTGVCAGNGGEVSAGAATDSNSVAESVTN